MKNTSTKIHGFREIGKTATELLLRQFAGDSRIEHRTLATKHFTVNLQ